MDGDTEPDEVLLNTAPSGVYEVIYAESRSTFQAVESSVALTTTDGLPCVYTGGLVAATSCPAKAAAFVRGAVPHGKGKLVCDDTGDCYEGEWQHGLRHGRGTWKGSLAAVAAAAAVGGGAGGAAVGSGANTTNNNTSLAASFVSGAAATDGGAAAGGGGGTTSSGQPLPERASYEGEWQHDLRHGKGIEQFLDGRVYVGEYKQGLCSGVGAMNFLNGDVYRGQFAAGVPHDVKGEYVFANGDALYGPWVDGKRHGTFSVSYASSSQHSYQANFVNDSMMNVMFIS